MSALNDIKELKSGNKMALKNNPWLMYLYLTSRKDINLERVSSLKELEDKNPVLDYVEKTLEILEGAVISETPDINGDKVSIPAKEKMIIEEVLKWSEVSKCGMPHQRSKWEKAGFNLFVHNIGSSQIYTAQHSKKSADVQSLIEKQIINTLIITHGLIGQYIRGEVNLSENMPITSLLLRNFINKDSLRRILFVLNMCIIKAASSEVWQKVEAKVRETIELIIENQYQHELPVKERIKRLRATSIANGENFEAEYRKHFTDQYEKIFEFLFSKAYLWYVESALSEFTLEEFLKIFLLIYREINPLSIEHISFEYLMKEVYYDYKDKKKINLYKMRILQDYLSKMTPEDILNGNYPKNKHVQHKMLLVGNMNSTVCFSFEFSPAGTKLIEFCQVSDTSDVLFKQATMLLLDLFGLRRDKFDRLYNEEDYLETMNQSIQQKTVVADYIPENVSGNTIIDIGPGKGALMDYIVEKYPDSNVIGVDVSQNVIDELRKIKNIQGKAWNFIKGDARNLKNLYKEAGELREYLKPGSVKAVVFCSVAHEIFSYNNFDYTVLAESFKSAFDILCTGGRIIIRDGIMTEPKHTMRIVRFKTPDGMKFLEKYAKDFKGRQIEYTVIGENEVKMPVNDCMEMLYTYTWGEESYAQEVQEQFGYFTPSEFKAFISETLGDKAKIIELKHYLQDGYEENLLPKIDIFDENHNPVRLPDSTGIIVIEKI